MKIRESLLSVLLATLVWSCSGSKGSGESEVRNNAELLVEWINAGQLDSIITLYPDIVKADSLNKLSGVENMKIDTDVADSLYTVTLENDVTFIFAKGTEGNYRVEKSYGLFAFPKGKCDMAVATGAFKDTTSDVEKAMLMPYVDKMIAGLYEAYCKANDNVIKVSGPVFTHEPQFAMDEAEGYYTLKNTGDKDVKGSDYKIKYHFTDLRGGYESYSSEPGKDIAAGGSVKIPIEMTGTSGSEIVGIEMTKPGIEEFMAVYKATGNEFEAYAPAAGETNAASAPVEANQTEQKALLPEGFGIKTVVIKGEYGPKINPVASSDLRKLGFLHKGTKTKTVYEVELEDAGNGAFSEVEVPKKIEIRTYALDGISVTTNETENSVVMQFPSKEALDAFLNTAREFGYKGSGKVLRYPNSVLELSVNGLKVTVSYAS